MNVLAIDAASPSPAVSLLIAGRSFDEPIPSDRRASEELLPAVRRVLAAAGARLEDCRRLAVCSGPGSFTGTRIGLATAWALGRALAIPVESVSTLEAMAETARPEGAVGALSGAVPEITAILDAGRGELLLERFALEVPRARSLGEPSRLPSTEALRALTDSWVALPADLLGRPGSAQHRSVASGLARAVARAPRETAEPMRANYSRPSAAEEKRGAS
jgi:tRNA threonylcarbamoyladenosine biosynthesis protein TsaB